jgi:alkylhydroperoxidase/carboxymuconolactone decarboxylase family protein YurZ
VKLAVSVGALREGAVHSHARKALAAGAAPAEMRHVAILSLPTIGFPGMMAALSWVNDVLDAPPDGTDAGGGAPRTGR